MATVTPAPPGEAPARPPRDDLFRAVAPGPSVREAETDGRTMYGYLAVFDEWAEIDSVLEGHFLEQVRPGAAAKTIRENRDRMRCIFRHGRDPRIGDKPLGTIEDLAEDSTGVAYEVRLLDASYVVEDVLPGLRAGLFGNSYNFKVLREDYVQRPAKADHNPMGLPERSVAEMRIFEFGPCTFPAYAGAAAGVRSLTDEVTAERLEAAGIVQRSGISLAGVEVQPESSARTIKATFTVDGAALANVMREDSEERLYRNATRYVSGGVWAMWAPALATLKAILAERAAGHKPTAEEIRERIGGRDIEDELLADVEEPETQESPVAVLPLVGSIVPRADLFTEVSGAVAMQDFQTRFREALADDKVTAILLDVDSPGGSADLVPEVAAEILAARGAKPIVAVANTFAASAAYWLAAAADELVVTPSGQVGSIGVYTAHTDLSKALEMEGEDITLISAGKYKVEGNPFEPLDAEAEAEMQRRVDAYYDMFVKAVANGRDVTAKTVLSEFGQGRMVMAEDAVKRGMADRVATFDDTLARLEKTKPAGRTAETAATVTTSRTKEPEPSEVTTPVAEPEPPGATTPQPTENATKEKVTMSEVAHHNIPELQARLSDVQAQIAELDSEYANRAFDEDAQARFDALKTEKRDLALLIDQLEQRTAAVAETAQRERNIEGPVAPMTSVGMTRGDDIYDLSTVRDSYSNPEGARSELISRAMRSVEGGRFPHPNVKREQAQDHIDGLFSRVKSGEGQDAQEQLALHLLRTGSPVYSRAFGKALAQAPMSNEERTALAIGGSGAAGNFAIPYQLDPTVIPVSNGSVNPIRQIARVESIVGANEWRGVTSTGMTASYAAEAAEVDDDAPVLVQPAIIVERADAFVPFSFEVGQDWTAMQAELARMTQDAKDDLEATKFLLGAGHGSTEPQGLLVGATTTVTTTGVQTFAVGDLYKLHEALPERFEPNARFLASRAIYNDIRQFDTGGGANLWVYLADGNPPELIGYPAHHTSGMATSPVGDNEKLMVFGDFRHYIIVDRIGMQIEIVPHLFATGANRPSGQRGFLAWWRNSAEVVAVNAFRVLVANDT